MQDEPEAAESAPESTPTPESNPQWVRKNGRGGYRPGSGRPKKLKRLERDAARGLTVDPEQIAYTLSKDAAREYVRTTVVNALRPLLQAQLMHAQGIGHAYVRDKHGKFARVEKLDEIDRLLAEGTEGQHYFIFAKDPSAVAFKELLDRALDKPKEQAHEVHVTGEIELSARLTAARARVLDVTQALDVVARTPEGQN